MVAGEKALKQLVADHSIFQSFDDGQLRELLGLVSATRRVPAGECLVREGDKAEEIFIIERGRFAVLKRDPKSLSAHQIGEVRPGMSVGEVALLDKGPRSATLQAIEDASVLVIPIDSVERSQHGRLPIGAQMKIALAEQMSGRFRNMAGATVEMLQARLDEESKRAEMGRFVSRVLFGTCLYMYALGTLQALKGDVADTTMVTVPLIALFAIGLCINIHSSIYPARVYGFTLDNWKLAVIDAVLLSLPVAVLIVVVKWMLVELYPPMAGQRVFDFYQSKDVGLVATLLAAVGYAIFAPVQELIARSGMQSSLAMFLTGPYRVPLSIFLSTLLFSSTHLHVSVMLAILVFPLGLFWGWLYARHPTLIGVSLSHVALGLFGLFIVGFPTKA